MKRLEQLRSVVQSSSQGSQGVPAWEALHGRCMAPRLQQVQLWYGGLFFPEAFLTASRQARPLGMLCLALRPFY